MTSEPQRRIAHLRWLLLPLLLGGAMLVALIDAPAADARDDNGVITASSALSSLRGGDVVLASLNARPQLWDVETRERIGGAFPNDPGINCGATDELDAVVTGVGGNAVMWNLDFAERPGNACRTAGPKHDRGRVRR